METVRRVLTIPVETEEPPRWSECPAISFDMLRLNDPCARRRRRVIATSDVAHPTPLPGNDRETNEEPVGVDEVALVRRGIHDDPVTRLRPPVLERDLMWDSREQCLQREERADEWYGQKRQSRLP